MTWMNEGGLRRIFGIRVNWNEEITRNFSWIDERITQINNWYFQLRKYFIKEINSYLTKTNCRLNWDEKS